MRKSAIVAELKRLDPTLKAAQMRRLSTLTVKVLSEVLRQQREWASDDYDDGIMRPVPRETAPSQHWQYRTRDGTPVLPWTIPMGPGSGADDEDDARSVMDEQDFFAEGDYSYEDIDRDWGDEDYEDTGYPDENS